jgi:hypothetical protein
MASGVFAIPKAFGFEAATRRGDELWGCQAAAYSFQLVSTFTPSYETKPHLSTEPFELLTG